MGRALDASSRSSARIREPTAGPSRYPSVTLVIRLPHLT